ncbi:uncharacterized protein LOC129752287 [Uranotaenia lowii]|uniref:uncharacterized protein LOC129752287 n=1 Tax=Uranotaenia lowii TaxID=190385 RepID=UPI0024793D1D|nr:uncharacterized protein LOC129752287 [Uranotaenia lowii]
MPRAVTPLLERDKPANPAMHAETRLPTTDDHSTKIRTDRPFADRNKSSRGEQHLDNSTIKPAMSYTSYEDNTKIQPWNKTTNRTNLEWCHYIRETETERGSEGSSNPSSPIPVESCGGLAIAAAKTESESPIARLAGRTYNQSSGKTTFVLRELSSLNPAFCRRLLKTLVAKGKEEKKEKETFTASRQGKVSGAQQTTLRTVAINLAKLPTAPLGECLIIVLHEPILK